MARDDRITIRVSQSEKKQIESWMEDDPNSDNVSQFLRTAARTYAQGPNQSIDQEEVVHAVEVGMSSVQEELENIKTRVAGVEATAHEPDDDVARLAREIAEPLPVHPNGNLPDLARDVPKDIGESTLRAARIISTPRAWASYFDRELPDVREALSLAYQWYPEVEYIEVKSTRRWYKTRDLTDHGHE